MATAFNPVLSSVERFPATPHHTMVTDELSRIMAMLKEACPQASTISFDFDGRLRVHIDIRNREDMPLIEATLPSLGAGLFHEINRGNTPNRPFFHRISALVDR